MRGGRTHVVHRGSLVRMWMTLQPPLQNVVAERFKWTRVVRACGRGANGPLCISSTDVL